MMMMHIGDLQKVSNCSGLHYKRKLFLYLFFFPDNCQQQIHLNDNFQEIYYIKSFLFFRFHKKKNNENKTQRQLISISA